MLFKCGHNCADFSYKTIIVLFLVVHMKVKVALFRMKKESLKEKVIPSLHSTLHSWPVTLVGGFKCKIVSFVKLQK